MELRIIDANGVAESRPVSTQKPRKAKKIKKKKKSTNFFLTYPPPSSIT